MKIFHHNKDHKDHDACKLAAAYLLKYHATKLLILQEIHFESKTRTQLRNTVSEQHSLRKCLCESYLFNFLECDNVQ